MVDQMLVKDSFVKTNVLTKVNIFFKLSNKLNTSRIVALFLSNQHIFEEKKDCETDKPSFFYLSIDGFHSFPTLAVTLQKKGLEQFENGSNV